MDITKPIIIAGSGNSLPFLNSQFYREKCGIPLKLKEIIKGNYTIGLNYFFRYGCITTFNMFSDWQFYVDNYKSLKKLPLIVGAHDPSLKSHKRDITHDNTILLKNSGIYHGKKSISLGCFSKQLIGIFSLSLAIALEFKKIFLIGYDACEVNGQTHFYQGVADLKKSIPIYIKGKLKDHRLHFRGLGKKENGKYNTSTYDIKKNLNKKWFAPFINEDVKIYNVSPNSAIDVFEKIDYETFYSKIKNNHIFQDQARTDIRRIIYDKMEKNNE